MILIAAIGSLELLTRGVAESFVPTSPYPNQGFGSQSKSYAKQKVTADENAYLFEYVFMDHKNRIVTWRWGVYRAYIDRLNADFGLPGDFFEPYPNTEAERNKRAEIMDLACFRVRNNYVVPDYEAIMLKNKFVTTAMHELMNRTLGPEASNTERFELMMKFCQDLPYDVPDKYYDSKITCGIYPPSLSLLKGQGDCDTKAMILASTFSNSQQPNKIAIISIPKHLFLGIRGVPKPYQKFITHQGEKYILCQPVGPARLNLGDPGPNYSPIKSIEVIEINS